MNNPLLLSLPRKKLILWLSVIAVILVQIHVVLQGIRFSTGHDYLFGIIPFFHLGEERNLPTIFSALLLLVNSFILFCIGRQSHRANNPFTAQWNFLGIIFFLLFFDELFSYHEEISHSFHYLCNGGTLFYFAWVIPALILSGILAVCYWNFLNALPSPVKKMVLIAVALFLGASVGLEIIEGWIASGGGGKTLTFAILSTIEESLEMAGSIAFINAFLLMLTQRNDSICIDLS